MKKSMKKRLIALICMVSMLCSMCWSAVPASAEDNVSEAITLKTAPEKDFSHWTFSDVGIADNDYKYIWDANTSYTNGKSLDKTIFQGKINFPTAAFGNFYIGDVQKSNNSLWRGFVFTGNGTDKLNFGFVGIGGTYYNETGNTGSDAATGLLATFDPEIAGVTLRGNSNLKVSFSVEYTNVANELVTMKVGVFFNGRLYNNTYFTVKDVPVEFLTQTIRLSSGTNAVGMKSAVADITLEKAPESKFTPWTFSTVGIVDNDYKYIWDANKSYTNGKSLDETIFQGNIHFPTESFGNFYIGDVQKSNNSLWRGFVFTGNGTDKLNFGFVGIGGTYYNETGNTGSDAATGLLATFDPSIAGTTLRGNKDLKVNFSVEYTSEADGLVTMKVGVFFDGGLYDNTYFTVKDVPVEFLTQTIRLSSGTNAVGMKSQDITLKTAPEKDFPYWTFSNVGIADGDYKYIWNADKSYTNGKSLDETIFKGKINFPTEAFGNFYIGNVDPSGGSLWRGFLFTGNGDKLNFGFVGTGGNYYTDKGSVGTTATLLATFDPEIAGTTLRGNKDLELGFSVKYTSEADGLVTMRVGVFFNGKLYDNTYYTVKDVPAGFLTQTIRLSSGTNAVGMKSEDITLETAPEKLFTPWTFSTVGITDGDYKYIWDANKSYTNGKSLDKTIFQGKINFPTGTFGNFYFGDVDPSGGSLWRGFVIGGNEDDGDTDKLNFGFVGTSGHYYNASGDTESDAATGLLATFDPEIAGVTLRGNKNLKVNFSVEYTSEEAGLVTMKVGVFFNGKLYDNTYYTVKDVPAGFLTQTIRLSSGTNAVGMKSENITLETAPEKDFPSWTFSNVGIADNVYGSLWNANYSTGKSLDKTIFQGKINFIAEGFGNFYIGALDPSNSSQWRGFIFNGNGTDKLNFGFVGTSGHYYNASGDTESDAATGLLATFDPEIAGTKLRGNKDLKVGFSVEYTSEVNGLVTMRVGVFFDGKLYNNTYYTVKDVPEGFLTQTIRCSGHATDAEHNKLRVASVEPVEVVVQPEITDSIAMNYAVTAASFLLKQGEPTMTFAMNGSEISETAGVQVGNTYVFTYPDIMAQNIADTITATLTVGEYTKTYEYSVLDYCVAVLNAETLNNEYGAAYTSRQMAALKDLVVDLVEYGAQVQEYRKPSISEADLVTTKLANQVSNYDQYDVNDDEDLSGLNGVVETKVTGDDTSTAYQWKSATLVLGNKVKIRCQFRADDTTNLTIKTNMGDEPVGFTATSTSGVYAFEIDNIYAYEYGKEILVQFYEGENQVGKTLHYSVNTYLDAKKDSEYKDLLLAIHNYGDAADAFATAKEELRVIFSSDVHYTDLLRYEYWFNDKAKRLQYWVDCIKAEHEKDPIDLLVINGDISLDYWVEGGSVLTKGEGTTGEFVETYLSQLPDDLPVFVMPGNHELYSDAKWVELTGNHRQGAMALNDTLFLFMDNYNADLDPIVDSDGTYTQTDVEYINTMMAKYPLCDVYLVGHYFDTSAESDEFKQLVAKNSRIKGLFAGHTHNASTITLGGDWGSKTIAQTGNFANTDEDDFWGFREFFITPDSTYSQFVKVPKDNNTDVANTTFERINEIVYAE